MSDRLSREEMKRDEVMEAVERSATFMEEHAKTLILIAVGVLVAVAVALGVNWWLDARAAEAGDALSEALEVYRAPVGPDAATQAAEAGYDGETFPDVASRRVRAAELFQAIEADYGMTDAADVAGLYLGQIAAEQGDKARARELWNDFLDAHDDHVLAAQVRVNLIHLDREEGQAEAVAQRLEPMLDATAEDRKLPADVVLWELAQTYDALDRGEEAEATYRRLAEEYPSSPYGAQARQRLPQPAGGMAPGGAMPLQNFG